MISLLQLRERAKTGEKRNVQASSSGGGTATNIDRFISQFYVQYARCIIRCSGHDWLAEREEEKEKSDSIFLNIISLSLSLSLFRSVI